MRFPDRRRAFPYWVTLSAFVAVLCIFLMHAGLTRRLDVMYLDFVSPWINTPDSHKVVPVAVDERTPLAREIGALTDDDLPHIASPWMQGLFVAVTLAILCAILYATGPTASLVATMGVASGAAFFAFMVLKLGHRFLFPSPVVLACFITYTSWTWWRQRALVRYVSREAARTATLNIFPNSAPAPTAIDSVSRRIQQALAISDALGRHAVQMSKWVNSLPEATLVASPDGVVALANMEATRLAARAQTVNAVPGATKTLVGLPIAQVLFAITSSHKAMNFAKQAVERLSDFTSDTHMQPADGTLTEGVELVDGDSHQLLIKFAAVPDFFGADCALVFDITDVTHLRKVELQRDVMFRFMSHDLRSRQAAILALVEQMRLSPPGMSNDEFRERVAQCGTVALTMVDDFLFLARAESQVAKLVSVDLALLLGDAIDDQWAQAKSKDIKIELKAEPGRLVFGDVQLLRRAFENILSNAVKFSFHHETIRVEIDEHRNMWQVDIIDSGVGMPANQTQEIYREFMRAGDGDQQGYGLGLSFVKRVVDSMGGQIVIQSAEGIGTTVTVRLQKFPDAPLRDAIQHPQ
jgi:signal transduction histidine kinase